MAREPGEIAAMLRRRTKELGLKEEEVAVRIEGAGYAPYELMQSADDNEFYGVWSLGIVKRVLDVLELNLIEVLGMECVLCEKGAERWRELAALPRNEIIRKRREELDLSKEDLLTKLGWTQWFAEYSGSDYPYRDWAEEIMSVYRAMEDSPDSIDDLILGDVQHIAEGLEIPLQLLLGVKCSRCSVET